MSLGARNGFFKRFSKNKSGNGDSSMGHVGFCPHASVSFSSPPVPVPPAPVTAKPKTEKFAEILSAPVVDLERIRNISWAGVPDDYRATVWRLFLDYEPVNSAIRQTTLEHKRGDYFDCVERVFSESQRHLWTTAQKQTEAQISIDLPRTHITLLRDARVTLLFERVLFVWSVRHPASGYVQGMNDLLQPFFFAFLAPHCPGKTVSEMLKMQSLEGIPEESIKEIEADCFWCFSKLLDGLQDLYTKDQPGLYKMLENLEKVVDRVDPALGKKIHDEEIQYQEFAFRWMNCLLVREFSMGVLFRLWDLYLSNHSKIATTHVYVCAAMLETLAPKLLGLSHAEFVVELQSIDPEKWTMADMEMITAQAYVYEQTCKARPSHIRSASMPAMKH